MLVELLLVMRMWSFFCLGGLFFMVWLIMVNWFFVVGWVVRFVVKNGCFRFIRWGCLLSMVDGGGWMLLEVLDSEFCWLVLVVVCLFVEDMFCGWDLILLDVVLEVLWEIISYDYVIIMNKKVCWFIDF